MIAWERGHTASAYGIIWGDADQNKHGGIFSAKCHSVDCSGDSKVLTELGSNKIEVIVLDDQKSRELRRIRTTCSAVYLYDVSINTLECGLWCLCSNGLDNSALQQQHV